MEAAPLAAISAVFSWRGACPAAIFDASGDSTASAVNPLISATLESLFSFYWQKDLNAGDPGRFGILKAVPPFK